MVIQKTETCSERYKVGFFLRDKSIRLLWISRKNILKWITFTVIFMIKRTIVHESLDFRNFYSIVITVLNIKLYKHSRPVNYDRFNRKYSTSKKLPKTIAFDGSTEVKKKTCVNIYILRTNASGSGSGLIILKNSMRVWLGWLCVAWLLRQVCLELL